MAGFILLLQALPDFFKLLNRLGDLLDRFMKWSNQNNVSKWIDELEQSVDKLEKAKTPNEKLDAAQSIVGAIRSIK